MINSNQNLNDIPKQFRQYEKQEKKSEEQVSAQNTTQNSKACQNDIRDTLFIFLILIILFDAI